MLLKAKMLEDFKIFWNSGSIPRFFELLDTILSTFLKIILEILLFPHSKGKQYYYAVYFLCFFFKVYFQLEEIHLLLWYS